MSIQDTLQETEKALAEVQRQYVAKEAEACRLRIAIERSIDDFTRHAPCTEDEWQALVAERDALRVCVAELEHANNNLRQVIQSRAEIKALKP